jgi:hypothetical protein
MTTEPHDEANSTALAADIRKFLDAARAGAKAEEDGRAAWRINTMRLAEALLTGRKLHQNDNNAFGRWLDANAPGNGVISDKDRWALLNMAEHVDAAGKALEVTTRRSWQLIWIEDIQPKVEVAKGFSNTGKPPGSPKPHGRPRTAAKPVKASPPPKAQPPVSPKPATAHAEEIADVKRRHAEDIEALEAGHANALAAKDEVIANVKAKCIEALKDIVGEQDKEIEALEAEHAEEIEALKREHAQILAAKDEQIVILKAARAKEVEALHAEIAGLKAQPAQPGRRRRVEAPK